MLPGEVSAGQVTHLGPCVPACSAAPDNLAGILRSARPGKPQTKRHMDQDDFVAGADSMAVLRVCRRAMYEHIAATMLSIVWAAVCCLRRSQAELSKYSEQEEDRVSKMETALQQLRSDTFLLVHYACTAVLSKQFDCHVRLRITARS